MNRGIYEKFLLSDWRICKERLSWQMILSEAAFYASGRRSRFRCHEAGGRRNGKLLVSSSQGKRRINQLLMTLAEVQEALEHLSGQEKIFYTPEEAGSVEKRNRQDENFSGCRSGNG